MKPFYLDGRWESSPTAQAVINPWNGETVAEVCLADAAQVERAVASSHRTFASTGKSPAAERAALLWRVAQGIRARQADFIAAIVAEAGKPVTYAVMEVERAQITFEQAAHEAVVSHGHTLEMEATEPGKGHFGLVRRFPIGVILGITPFNFPLNLVAHKVAPCLATGNTMVLKPALKTPLSALLLAEVLHEAGVPAGQINVVPFSHQHIPPLLRDRRIKMLSFTGSVAVGWKLKSAAAKQKVALELGGNAAVIVEADSAWQAAIPKIAAGAFGYAGQSCISVQRIFVQASIYEAFRRALISFVSTKIPVGNPEDRAVVVGPMINPTARDKVVQWVREAVAGGARLLTPLQTESLSLLHPVLIENAPRDSAVVCEEAFAPVAVLESYETFAEALGRVNDSVYGLQAGVFTSDITKAMKAFEEIETGGVLINQTPTFRVENMPYGGVKNSGFGREGVRYAMEEMTELRSLVINLG